MIINMCITPNSASDARRPREVMAASGKDASHTGGGSSGMGNSPKVRMIYENMCFLLDSRKIYLDKDISLVRLSQMLYTNTTYLSRVINKYFGCNLKALLNRYRVKHAKDLLGDEKCNMEELPAQCGFSSRSAFYNAFVRFEHMTPTEYRAIARTQALRAGESQEGRM